MKNKFFLSQLFFLVFVFCLMAGCAHIQEAAKQLWGSSISHLEKERPNGQSQDFALPLDRCFQEVQDIVNFYRGNVYLKDEKKRYMAAMGFKGFVDTTEVGIFFTVLDDQHTKIEVASMSPKLMRKVAGYIFTGLQKSIATQ
ncbi:MAG: hypothetical protein ABIC68_01360 [Candidatus Omnitrophota bacterium]